MSLLRNVFADMMKMTPATTTTARGEIGLGGVTPQISQTGFYPAYPNFYAFISFCNQFVIPVMIVTGIVGNILTFLVFVLSSLKRNSTSVYLAALALTDSGFLVSLGAGWMENLHVYFIHQEPVCTIIVYVTYILSFLSVWFVVCFTTEMYLTLFHEDLAAKINHPSKARAVVLILTGLSALAYLHTFWTTKQITVQSGRQTCGFVSEEKVRMGLSIMDTLLTLVLPFTLLIFMNTRILVVIIRFSRKRGTGDRKNGLDDNTSTNINPSSPRIPCGHAISMATRLSGTSKVEDTHEQRTSLLGDQESKKEPRGQDDGCKQKDHDRGKEKMGQGHTKGGQSQIKGNKDRQLSQSNDQYPTRNKIQKRSKVDAMPSCHNQKSQGQNQFQAKGEGQGKGQGQSNTTHKVPTEQKRKTRGDSIRRCSSSSSDKTGPQTRSKTRTSSRKRRQWTEKPSKQNKHREKQAMEGFYSTDTDEASDLELAERKKKFPGKVSKMQRKSFKMLLTVAIVFLILNLPSHVVRLQGLVRSIFTPNYVTSELEHLCQQLFQLFFYFNFVANFIIYNVCAKSFRTAFLTLPFVCSKACSSCACSCYSWKHAPSKTSGRVAQELRRMREEQNSRLVEVNLDELQLHIFNMESFGPDFRYHSPPCLLRVSSDMDGKSKSNG